MLRSYENREGLDREVLFVLNFHKGEKNAVGRWELVRRVYGDEAVSEETMSDGNKYDRAVRMSIERLRHDGNHICNRGNGNGYYIADSRDEYKQFVRYYLGPSYPKFENVKAMDAAADARWGREPKQAPEEQMALGLGM